MKIITNNTPRPIIYGYDLSEKEKQEFGYLDDVDSASFARYKGAVYDLGEFQRVSEVMENCHGFKDWHGFLSESFFSGVVIKYMRGFEEVVIGRWYA